MEPLVSVRGIRKSFGKKEIISDLSFDLFPGEIVGLIGRSGCGKSTLIKMLVGYYHPDEGSITFSHKDAGFHDVRHLVGYTPQEPSFYDKLSVAENMRYYADLYDVEKVDQEKRIAHLVSEVGLDYVKTTLAGRLSGGQKRRLDFALSLLHDPKLVVLDEPTAGLDPVLVDGFWKTVQAVVKERRIAVIVSSHILSELEENCSRVLVMASGRMVKEIAVTSTTKLDSHFRRLTS